MGPNTDGCECTTPACCGTNCQTIHDDGLGHPFYDCRPLGTYDVNSAIAACQAYAASIQGSPANCTGDWTCNHPNTMMACYSASYNICTMCWNYSGMGTGLTTSCECPASTIGTWQ
jgi:hypothetical protein